MLPSCSTSSTSINSSVWVIFLSPLTLNTLDSRRFQRVKRKFTGVSSHMKARMMGAENMAKRSGLSLARLLGEISPKISTTTVTTAVEIVAPISP